jgi:N-acetylglucosaminyldiphosphoundecaprenol N-acetyl-beta-D-mannosaminyltransferase
VLVGMGTPKQELWVDRYADRLNGAVVWTVGALFDYVSGHTPRAPRWLADNGLEWIFRLTIEPQRMWRRYLLGNPIFLSRVASEARRDRRVPTSLP